MYVTRHSATTHQQLINSNPAGVLESTRRHQCATEFQWTAWTNQSNVYYWRSLCRPRVTSRRPTKPNFTLRRLQTSEVGVLNRYVQPASMPQFCVQSNIGVSCRFHINDLLPEIRHTRSRKHQICWSTVSSATSASSTDCGRYRPLVGASWNSCGFQSTSCHVRSPHSSMAACNLALRRRDHGNRCPPLWLVGLLRAEPRPCCAIKRRWRSLIPFSVHLIAEVLWLRKWDLLVDWFVKWLTR